MLKLGAQIDEILIGAIQNDVFFILNSVPLTIVTNCDFVCSSLRLVLASFNSENVTREAKAGQRSKLIVRIVFVEIGRKNRLLLHFFLSQQPGVEPNGIGQRLKLRNPVNLPKMIGKARKRSQADNHTGQRSTELKHKKSGI